MRTTPHLSYSLISAALLFSAGCATRELSPTRESGAFARAAGGIPFVQAAPAIDGRPGDPAWEEAILVNEFTTSGSQADASANNAKAWICRDTDHLYVALLAEHDSFENARNLHLEHDGPIYADDDLEVFLDAAGDGSTFYQVVANVNGAIFDRFVDERKNSRVGWDSGARAAGSRTVSDYYIEMSIPLRALNATASETPRIGIAVARGIPYNRDFKKALGEFHKPSTWTYFPLRDKNTVFVEDFSYSAFEGERDFAFELVNPGDTPIRLSGSFNGAPASLALAAKGKGTLQASTFLTAGQTVTNELRLADSDGREAVRWYRVFTPRELLEVQPRSDLIYEGESLELSISINEEPDAEVEVALTDARGKLLHRVSFLPTARLSELSLPFRGASGKVTCRYKTSVREHAIETTSSPWRDE